MNKHQSDLVRAEFLNEGSCQKFSSIHVRLSFLIHRHEKLSLILPTARHRCSCVEKQTVFAKAQIIKLREAIHRSSYPGFNYTQLLGAHKKTENVTNSTTITRDEGKLSVFHRQILYFSSSAYSNFLHCPITQPDAETLKHSGGTQSTLDAQ